MCAQRGRQKQELKSRVKASSGKVCPLCKAASLLVKGFHQGNNVIRWGVQTLDGTVMRRGLTPTRLELSRLGGRFAGLLERAGGAVTGLPLED